MTYRRLLTSLAAHPPSSSASRLIPPYAQTLGAGPTTLRPPYEHALGAHEVRGRSLKAPRRFEMILSSPSRGEGREADAHTSWAQQVLGSDELRERVQARWTEVVDGLQKIRAGQLAIPQIAFHNLASHLASPESIETIKTLGLVVVRDVIPDVEAVECARAVLVHTGERGGKATYWHPSLLSARSNPSVLSANSLLASSLLGAEGVYVTASSVVEGLAGRPVVPATPRSEQAQAPESWSDRSLLSHLTLTPSIPTAQSVVSPSTLSAEYVLLRPLFRARKSKIAFYSSTAGAYLDADNWSLLDAPTSSHSTDPVDLPHLAGVQTALPELMPGDMVLHHATLPIHTSEGSGQVFLPLHPVPRSDGAFAAAQRQAFEKGVPPPGVQVDGLWELENPGRREMLGGRAGREAMGY